MQFLHGNPQARRRGVQIRRAAHTSTGTSTGTSTHAAALWAAKAAALPHTALRTKTGAPETAAHAAT